MTRATGFPASVGAAVLCVALPVGAQPPGVVILDPPGGPTVAAVGIERTGNAFYDVAVNARTGAYAARTGPEHPVTSALGEPSQVIAFGGGFTTGATFNAVRSWSSGTDYRFGIPPTLLDPSPGFGCVTAADIPAPDLEWIQGPGGRVGFSQVWEIDQRGDRFAVEQRILARGEEFTESAVQVTLSVTNRGAGPLRIGAGFLWDFAVGNRGGSLDPVMGPKPPEPVSEPLVLLERRFDRPGFRSYILSNEEYPSDPGPVNDNPYVVEGTVAGIPIAPAPARPDRLQQTYLGWTAAAPAPQGLGPFNACFDYVIPDPPRYATGSMAGYYQWGPTEDTAVEIAPGATWSATQYIFAYLEFPLTCDAGGPYTEECQGPVTEVALDGTGSSNLEGEAIHHLWTPRDPAVSLRDATSARPVAEVRGLGRHTVDLLAHNGPYATGCEAEVEVVDTIPPVVRSASVSPSVLWPPDHKMVPVHVEIEAEDLCEGAARVRLLEVRSDEPDEAIPVGDGRTSRDIQGAELGTADMEVLLRAERQGTADGRTYTLVYEVSDSSGNRVLVPLEVVVPHDEGR